MALRTLRPMHLLYVLVLLVSFFGQGCVTSSEGDRLAAESRSHGQRLEALERRVQAVETKLKEVEDVLSRSTQIVARKSADLAVEIRALEEKLQAADGRFAELQHALEQAREEWKGKLDTITRKAGADMQLSSSEIPSSKEAHFQAAQQAYRQSDYPKARALFREYVSRYAQDDLADNAQYWIGASYLRENQPARALGEYRKVISSYATGDAADETLLDMADAFYKLNACGDAQAALKTLQRDHKRSPLLPRSQTMLQQIKQAPKGYCRN